MYQHITLKQLRPKLPKVINSVDERLDRFVISKRGDPIAILLSIDDYESMIETLNEISDKENLKKIRLGLKEAKKGNTISWTRIKTKHKL
ncbi:MAG: hypothetical protein A3G32_05540 [Deltaproteobacteria bacterium RIFCSPLOWO2_12_FULL_40_28]|nr:MAG: hypothetical protein A3C45_03710 [Deltaproteobacteria bacterium RIFCSPHIGHO2_02_FULL_40_28]OGQ18931.1 MAG: hypothetical protein A3E27_09540 [Deltaproteobacteria bacterium RIFCSPHIGHO2_12_FULL_40_32]OGQ39474.1 MAG: hypothetical protein A3I69_09655 [Deltaproteobacteria bacterium RIFCSPLOWO2_02_FULL_40_36]OGQ53364.1 MAG: hypothetical protein A3G32_05540 [Deltaproteobacteria bacterium RIFCSPLOWO2_12_FULL_40_28]